jgi:hypothetical protein
MVCPAVAAGDCRSECLRRTRYARMTGPNPTAPTVASSIVPNDYIQNNQFGKAGASSVARVSFLKGN